MPHRYFYPPDSPDVYRPVKKAPEKGEKIEQICSALQADGCVKAIVLPDGKVDTPPEYVEQIFGGKFFTQIEIINAGSQNVHFHEGLYAPTSSLLNTYCNIIHYENWDFGKEGKKPFWQRYLKGN